MVRKQGGRDGDIITTSAMAAMWAVWERKGPNGWTSTGRLTEVEWRKLSDKFLEVKEGYVRLTNDARTILKFSQDLESK